MINIYFIANPIFFIITNSPIFFINSIQIINYWVYFFFPVAIILNIIINYLRFNSTNKLEKKITNIFYTLILTIIVLCLVIENNFLFLIMFELSLITIIIFISNLGKDKDKIPAIFFILLINTIGSIPFITFIFVNYKNSNSFSLIIILSLRWLNYINRYFQFFILNIIFFFKLPLIIFHFWLTKAHVRAPGPRSIVLASIILKLSSIGILKFSFMFIKIINKLIPILSFFFYLSSFIIPLFIIRCFDLKYIIALSSIIHISIIPILCYINNQVSIIRSVIIIVRHGLISSFLFFLITLIYEQTNNRSIEFCKSIESIDKQISIVLILFLFINFGLPPIIRFLTEVLTIYRIIKISILISIIVILSIVISNTILIFFSSKILIGKKYNIIKKETKITLIHLVFSNITILLILPFII